MHEEEYDEYAEEAFEQSTSVTGDCEWCDDAPATVDVDTAWICQDCADQGFPVD